MNKPKFRAWDEEQQIIEQRIAKQLNNQNPYAYFARVGGSPLTKKIRREKKRNY